MIRSEIVLCRCIYINFAQVHNKEVMMMLGVKLKPPKPLGPRIEQISTREAHFALIKTTEQILGDCKMSFIFFLALCKEKSVDPFSRDAKKVESIHEVAIALCNTFNNKTSQILPSEVLDLCLDIFSLDPAKNAIIQKVTGRYLPDSTDHYKNSPIREKDRRVGKGVIRPADRPTKDTTM